MVKEGSMNCGNLDSELKINNDLTSSRESSISPTPAST